MPQVRAAGTEQPRTHRAIELFAGVGGFRFALEQVNHHTVASGGVRSYDVVWANQWEPHVRKQNAAAVYRARWGHSLINRDIDEVLADASEMERIRSLAPTMLVAGFPCQDYSVAKPVSLSAGIQGTKGALWWSIYKLVRELHEAGQPLEVLLLENVDRLLASPACCPGREFAVILASLQALGYAVFWQVVTAADYGFAQRRKRVFIVAVHSTSLDHGRWVAGEAHPAPSTSTPLGIGLPVEAIGTVEQFALSGDVFAAQSEYQPRASGRSVFAGAGVCVNGVVRTVETKADWAACALAGLSSGPRTLGEVVARTGEVAPEFYVPEDALPKWQYLKGRKAVARVNAAGLSYTYSEGAVAFPDPLDKPSRTIITSEGGMGPSRTRHAVATQDGRIRRLTPEELEELNGFPRGFTAIDGLTASERAFLMGNALVTGVVARIALGLVAR